MPAAILARELNIRYVETLCIASYEHDRQGNLTVIKKAQEQNQGEGFLIVDDLVDTGKTAAIIRQLYPKGYFVAVFAKSMGQPQVYQYIMKIEQDTWIEQPWDMDIKLNFVAPISE